MKPFYGLGLMIVLCYGCKSDLQKDIIRIENENNQVRVHKIIEIGPFHPIFGHDSVKALELAYDSTWESKMASLNKQLKQIEGKHEQALAELKTLTNPNMKKAYNMQVKNMHHKIVTTKKIIAFYKNHPEQTQFGQIESKIDFYSQCRDSILGYTFSATFIGSKGTLKKSTQKHTYFTDAGKNEIIALK